MEKHELNSNLPSEQFVGEFIGTMQQSVIIVWQYHLSGSVDYSTHLILDDYYKNMPELIDRFAEEWMGVSGEKIAYYSNIIDKQDDNYIKYLTMLRNYADEFSRLFVENQCIQSNVHSIIGLINSTLYKLNQLCGCNNCHNSIKDNIISLSDFVVKF